MIHVPDVRATVAWYQDLGFKVIATYGDDGDGFSFGMVSFVKSEVMFNKGGRLTHARRREVDLYAYIENIDDFYERIKDRVDLEATPHDTFYGMREFIIRDLNGFWITFGQQSVFGSLMQSVRENSAELVKATLEGRNVKPQTLAAAMAAALLNDEIDSEIVGLLSKAGAVTPPRVDAGKLQSYVGRYEGEEEFVINVSIKLGTLFAAPGRQDPMRLMAIDQTTFTPIAFDDYGTITFHVKDSNTEACTLRHGAHATQLKRVNNHI